MIDIYRLDEGAGTTDYEEHLRSEEWWHRRLLMYAFTRWACEWCGAENQGLHVHHVHYRTLGRETPRDLLVLCERCHAEVHDDSHDLTGNASFHPESWQELRDFLGYEPRENHARAKLSALVWKGL